MSGVIRGHARSIEGVDMNNASRDEQELVRRLSGARARVAVLEELLEAERRSLELFERSLQGQPSESVRNGATDEMGYALGNSFVPASTQISIYLGLLRELFEGYPEKREHMRRAVAGAGRNRTYIATDRSALFSGKDRDWVTKNSVVLIPGWFADTNINLQTKQRNLTSCAQAAGLRDGIDFDVVWRP